MPLLWDDFLPDVRAGDVGGTFYYFDTEAQPIIIRDTDMALISTYDEVELGQWLDSVWENNLRIGNFGLSQFVPRHNYNGEIWAVGIVPTLVPEETGRFPTPAIPTGFYLYRYKYYQDVTDNLESLNTYEQTEYLIKDARAEVNGISEEEVNKTSSILAVGSRMISKLGIGNSSKAFLSTVYLDKVDWSRVTGKLRLTGRNAIGYYLSEQTFDEAISYAGTRTSVLRDMIQNSGVDMKKVFIEEHEWPMTALFKPTDTVWYGVKHLTDIFGWKVIELPNGKIVIGSNAFISAYNKLGNHSFMADEVVTRELILQGSGAFSRIALQSYINAVEETPAFTRYVYKDIGYFDGWSIGGKKTLYITVLDDMTEADMQALADEYAKAYQFIGVAITREFSIHPEIQSGDILQIADAKDNEYILEGIVTSVRHVLDIDGGRARTIVSVNSGGTITEISGSMHTYTANDVDGDTRRRELIDVIKRAIKNT